MTVSVTPPSVFSLNLGVNPTFIVIVNEGGLASNGPHIKQLNRLDLRFISGAKELDHRFLFDWVANTKATQTHEFKDEAT